MDATTRAFQEVIKMGHKAQACYNIGNLDGAGVVLGVLVERVLRLRGHVADVKVERAAREGRQ